MDFFEEYAYNEKATNKRSREQEYGCVENDMKKIKSKEHFTCPNILCYTCNGYKLEWILADPAGNILDTDVVRKSYVEYMLIEILQLCKSKNIIVVTFKIDESLRNSVHKDDVFCIMDNSFSRCGIVKLDGKLKDLSIQDVNGELKIAQNFGTECEKVLQIFIEGRIKGWW